MTVVLPAPLSPTSATRPPGVELEVEAVEHRGAPPGAYRAVTFSSATAGAAGGGGRRGRVGDPARPLDQLEHAAAGGERGSELLRRGGERRTPSNERARGA